MELEVELEIEGEVEGEGEGEVEEEDRGPECGQSMPTCPFLRENKPLNPRRFLPLLFDEEELSSSEHVADERGGDAYPLSESEKEADLLVPG
jgi:hypothetical protein